MNPGKKGDLELFMAEARRAGLSIDKDVPLDLIKMDREMRASGASTEKRFRVKTLAAQLGLIPASYQY
jgi:hypothetical protein